MCPCGHDAATAADTATAAASVAAGRPEREQRHGPPRRRPTMSKLKRVHDTAEAYEKAGADTVNALLTPAEAFRREISSGQAGGPPEPIGAQALRAQRPLDDSEEEDVIKTRKLTHSQVERRRRDRINERINALKNLVPTCTGLDNLHKMAILDKVAEHIQFLSKENEMVRRECHQLRLENAQLRTQIKH